MADQKTKRTHIHTGHTWLSMKRRRHFTVKLTPNLTFRHMCVSWTTMQIYGSTSRINCSNTQWKRMENDGFLSQIRAMVKSVSNVYLAWANPKTVFQIIDCLLRTSKLPLRILVTVKQQVFTRDTSDHVADFSLLIRNYADDQTGEKRNIATVAFDSKRFTPI